MTTTETTCPADVLEWIAWYPDQGLTDRQRGAVEAHAAGCVPCREEISMILGRAEPETAPPDPESMLARLRQRIDATESESVPRPAVAHPEAVGRPGRGLEMRPALAAAAAAALALIGLVAGLTLGGAREPSLQTATGSATGSATGGVAASGTGGPALDVVFADDASASHIARALRTIHGEIVGGPTPLGRYRVALPSGGDAESAARQLRSGETNLVVFAEPTLR
jgi:hypothetical protein